MVVDLDQFPTSESAKRMLSYISEDFYKDSYVGKWLFQVMGLEWDAAWEIIDSLPEQAFPETATWGLKYHEQKWHLPVREDLDYDTRRKSIYQKRDYRAPMNPYNLEKYLANATGFEVHIEDVHDEHLYGWTPPHPNTFIVYFEGDGTLDVATAKARLKQLRQSHTTYVLQERINDIVDNAAIWRFDNYRLILEYAISFWGEHLLNGIDYLDGSLLLNGGTRRYDLIPGIKYVLGDAESTEKIDSPRMKILGHIQENEVFGGNATVATAIAVYFWDCLKLDGALLLDGSKNLNEIRRTVNPTVAVKANNQIAEKISIVSLRTVRNLAYMDGSLKLDGSRVLNSIDRKEEL